MWSSFCSPPQPSAAERSGSSTPSAPPCPRSTARHQLPGLSAEVTVRRDEHGVPHIQAANLDDLFAAQGYVTAQDRLWQMDMTRRYVAGEIAEVLGKGLVAHDRVQRLLEMRPTAERIIAGLSDRDRPLLRRLRARRQRLHRLPSGHASPPSSACSCTSQNPGGQSTPCSSCLGMVQMEDERWDSKLEHEQVVAKLGPTLAASLYPVGLLARPSAHRRRPRPHAAPGKHPRRSSRRVPNQTQDLLQLRELLGHDHCDGCAIGSNEWAVSGAHTASGKPLMSNDMHITHQIPNIWYEVDLKAPGPNGADFHVAGVSNPGAPFVTSGHNDHISWGFTSLYGDTQDIYIEKVNDHDQYQSPNGWKPIEHVRETIRVRGGNDIVIDVGRTGHGPIITPAIEHEQRMLSLRWSAYDPGANSIPLFDINSASNWTEFRNILGRWWGPSLNVIYADDQGHIGYQAVGFIPIRDGGLTTVPVPAGTHEWQGFVPFDQMPSAEDPANGILATANSRITPDGYPYRSLSNGPRPIATNASGSGSPARTT